MRRLPSSGWRVAVVIYVEAGFCSANTLGKLLMGPGMPFLDDMLWYDRQHHGDEGLLKLRC